MSCWVATRCSWSILKQCPNRCRVNQRKVRPVRRSRFWQRAHEVWSRPSRAYHLRRADYLERSGDVAAARRARAEADSIKPDGAFDHFLLGLAEYKRGFLKAAIQQFGETLFAQPSHFWAQCYLANCELNLRPPHPAEAKIRLTACLKSHPEASWLYLMRGFASCELGADSPSAAEKESHFQDAEADYRDALDRDPRGRFRYALLANRGLLRIHSGRLDEALADLKTAIDAQSSRDECLRQHGPDTAARTSV